MSECDSKGASMAGVELPISYGKQWITEADIAAVTTVLESAYLTQGPQIQAFESAFASYVGAKYAVAVSNGTAGLHLGAMALGLQPGDRVIVPTITFAASANCVRYCGGEVVFCDIDPQSYNISLERLESLLRSHPKGYFKGVVPVDFAGYPVDMERVCTLADAYGLWVMEDACHAPGGEFKNGAGERCRCGEGRYADVAVFSFHPVKHITTGEGGMVTTNDKALYERLCLLRTHGITREMECLQANHGGWYYEMQALGFNYRMTDVQAALGISQLTRAAEGVARRRAIAARYDEAFADCEHMVTPWVDSKKVQHAYHLYVIQVPNRLKLYNDLRERGVYAQVHYIPVHLQPYYQQLGSKEGDCPVAEQYYAHCLSLPMYPTLRDAEQEYVIERVREGVGF